MKEITWTCGPLPCNPNSLYAILSHDNNTTTITKIRLDGKFKTKTVPVMGVPTWINTITNGICIGYDEFVVTYDNDIHILHYGKANKNLLKNTKYFGKTPSHVLFYDKNGAPRGLCLSADEIIHCDPDDISHIVTETEALPYHDNENVIFHYFREVFKFPETETILYLNVVNEQYIDVFTKEGDLWRVDIITNTANVIGLDITNIIDVVFIH